jgi:hypothetical protein
MEGAEAYKLLWFCIDVNVARVGRMLLQLHHGAVEVTVDLHCKTVYFNQLFGDI